MEILQFLIRLNSDAYEMKFGWQINIMCNWRLVFFLFFIEIDFFTESYKQNIKYHGKKNISLSMKWTSFHRALAIQTNEK